MVFNKKKLIAFVSLFLLVSSTLRAAECYEEYRKSCIENNGPRNISSAFSCTMNEQAFTKTMYGEFDSYNVLDLDDTIAYHTRVVKGEDGGGVRLIADLQYVITKLIKSIVKLV